MNLVYINDYGLLGSNYYWNGYEKMGLSKEDILSAGLKDDRIFVDQEIIAGLKAADEIFRQRGFRLFLKEGYRSEALYKIVYKRRISKFGQQDTDKLMNIKEMPHAYGKAVDVCLWSESENSEVKLRNNEDGIAALIIDFYKDKNDLESKKYQELQEFLINTMLDCGFRIGERREYWHFNYRPEAPRNYPFNNQR